ncbi:hypothetical protein TSOC_011995, partial [Tetrabaena socialis]
APAHGPGPGHNPGGAGPAAPRNPADDRSGSPARPDARAGGPSGSALTLLSVPLGLCISHEVPGCCPPALASPALRAVFSAPAATTPWEVALAAALLWSCRRADHLRRNPSHAHPHAARQPAAAGAAGSSSVGGDPLGGGGAGAGYDAGSGVCASGGGSSRAAVGGGPANGAGWGGGGGGGYGTQQDGAAHYLRFWEGYGRLLPPVEALTSLLFFSERELQELQDADLAAEARAWQAVVLDGYDRWIASPEFRAEAGEVSLQDWLRAVGAVESRAFGFKDADGGRPGHAYIPFFCFANYQPGAPTLHVLRRQQEAPMHIVSISCQPFLSLSDPLTRSFDLPALHAPPPASRSLAYQYGFVLHGNPYDRLDWGGLKLDASCRMRRDWVHAAAERLATEAGVCEAAREASHGRAATADEASLLLAC